MNITGTSTAALDLSDRDPGMGTTVIRLYRDIFCEEELERTSRFLTDCGPQKSYDRSYRALSKLLEQFHYPFCPEEKRDLKREAGCLNGPTSFLKIARSGQRPYPWMLLRTSCPALAGIIMDRAHYRNVEDQLGDLKKLQKYARMSRRLTLLRFAELYYGIKSLEEVAFDVHDYSCYEIDTARKVLRPKGDAVIRDLFQGHAVQLVYQFRPQRTKAL